MQRPPTPNILNTPTTSPDDSNVTLQAHPSEPGEVGGIFVLRGQSRLTPAVAARITPVVNAALRRGRSRGLRLAAGCCHRLPVSPIAATVISRGFYFGGIRRRDSVGGDEGKAGEVEVRGEHQPLQAGDGGGRCSDHDDAAIRGDFGLRQEAPGQEVERGRLLPPDLFFNMFFL